MATSRPVPSRFSFLAALIVAAGMATATALRAEPPAPAPVPDELLAKVTKVLRYGELIGTSKPSKMDAVIALGLIGDERSIPVLTEHLENESNNSLRLQLTRALCWIGSPKCVPALEIALKDSYPLARKQAAAGLKAITGRDYDYDKTGLPERLISLEKLRQATETPEAPAR